MRILITGSRTWQDNGTIERALWRLMNDVNLPWFGSPNVTIVHGGARGADTIAGNVGWKQGWVVEEHRANWKEGKGAGLIRNAYMVSLGADVCLAFINQGSRGATHCATLAREAGIPTLVFRDNNLLDRHGNENWTLLDTFYCWFMWPDGEPCALAWDHEGNHHHGKEK